MPIKSNPFMSFFFSLEENLGKRLPRTFSISLGYLPNMIGSKILYFYLSIFTLWGSHLYTLSESIEKATILVFKGELYQLKVNDLALSAANLSAVELLIGSYHSCEITIPILPFCSAWYVSLLKYDVLQSNQSNNYNSYDLRNLSSRSARKYKLTLVIIW